MAFFTKITIFFGFVFFMQFPALAQDKNSYWEASYGMGSVIEHHKLIEFLYKDYPQLYTLGWHQSAAKDSLSWKERYNYPDQGFVLQYERFNNEHIGNALAANYTTTFYLRNRNARHQCLLQLGFGAVYNTHPLDFDHDVSNIVMSTHVLYSQYVRLAYTYPYLSDKLGVSAGIGFAHYSNGAVKKPNLGLNTVLLTLAVRYHNQGKPESYVRANHRPKLDSFFKKTHGSVSAGFGFHESMPHIGRKPVYNLSMYLSKRLNYGNGIHGGVAFYNSQSFKEYALYQAVSNPENPEKKPKDHRQISIFAGHEMFFDKLSFTSKLGYYIYNPLKAKTPVYAVIGFKRYFNHRKSALSVNLKVHNFEADHFSLNYHHQMF